MSPEFSSGPENTTLSELLDRNMPADAEAIGEVDKGKEAYEKGIRMLEGLTAEYPKQWRDWKSRNKSCLRLGWRYKRRWPTRWCTDAGMTRQNEYGVV